MLLGNVHCFFHWMLFYGFSCILQHPFWQVKLSYLELIDVVEEPWQECLQMMWCYELVPSVSLSTRGICSSCIKTCSASHLLCLCAADPETASEIACLKKHGGVLTHHYWTCSEYPFVILRLSLAEMQPLCYSSVQWACPGDPVHAFLWSLVFRLLWILPRICLSTWLVPLEQENTLHLLLSFEFSLPSKSVVAKHAFIRMLPHCSHPF